MCLLIICRLDGQYAEGIIGGAQAGCVKRHPTNEHLVHHIASMSSDLPVLVLLCTGPSCALPEIVNALKRSS